MKRGIKLIHPDFGTIIDKEFSDKIQFKLFMDLLNLSLNNDRVFSIYDGKDDLFHIPNHIVKQSIIFTY
jgi:hypothetical protein